MAQGKTSSKQKKALIATVIVIVAIAVLVLVGARLFFRVPVISYYRASEKAFKIPGLFENMVPQGLDYLESEGFYLVGGYQKDGSPSRVYLIEKQTGKTKGYVLLGDKSGNGMAVHAGGLAANGDYLYVGGNEEPFVYVFKLSEVLSAGNGQIVKTLGKFDTKYGDYEIRADFMCFYDGKFFVGEYYRDPNFPTPGTHAYNCPSGETNCALMFSYEVSGSDDSVFGLDPVACEVYSLPDKAQGIVIHDDKMWISMSYGTGKSIIACYDVFGKSAGVFDPNAGTAELFVLYKGTLTGEFKAPPMSEEIIFVDGKMLIMCESASAKYVFGNFTGGRWCYATDVNKL
ncbi:MAG: hypothetical protein J5623_03755 [Clostridiales bacterium]|nr:hypothetical protein [Clostridiales bacterium]